MATPHTHFTSNPQMTSQNEYVASRKPEGFKSPDILREEKRVWVGSLPGKYDVGVAFPLSWSGDTFYTMFMYVY